MTNAHRQEFAIATPLISSKGRRVLLLVSFFNIPLLFIASVLQGTFNPLIGTAIACLGFFLMYFATSPRRRYYSPVVWSIWFQLGCVLSYISLLLNETYYKLHSSPVTGAFQFTDAEAWAVIPYFWVTILGIISGTLIAERFSPPLSSRWTSISRFRSQRGALLLSVLWTVVGISVSVLLGHFEIGRTGLVNQTVLPFRLAGLLNYSRSFLIPTLGIMILDLSLRSRSRNIILAVGGAFLLVGIIGSITALSRGYLGFMLLSLLVYACANLGRNGLTPAKIFRLAPLPLLVTVFSIYYVNLLRSEGFSGRGITLLETFEFLANSDIGSFSELVLPFFNIATSRIGGLQELLGVLSAPHLLQPSLPWAFFYTDGATVLWITQSVTNTVIVLGDTIATGFSFSAIGTLALSGNLFIVFIGIVLVLAFPLLVEEVAFRKGGPSMALTLSVLVGIQSWGFLNLGVMIRMIGILAIIILGIPILIKNLTMPANSAERAC